MRLGRQVDVAVVPPPVLPDIKHESLQQRRKEYQRAAAAGAGRPAPLLWARQPGSLQAPSGAGTGGGAQEEGSANSAQIACS